MNVRIAVLIRDRFVCSYCVDPATEVDHIYPVCQGGTDDFDNLTAACKRCNCSKGGLDPWEWAAREGMTLPPWWG